MSKFDEMTIGEAKELAKFLGSGGSGKSHSLKVGENYFVQTVTAFFTGKLESLTDSDLELSSAAWIASTGRFATALATGVFDEVEPYPGTAIISRDAIMCVSPWPHALPREQK